MQSKSASPAVGKGFSSEKDPKSTEPAPETARRKTRARKRIKDGEIQRRINGYFRRVFEQGAPFDVVDKWALWRRFQSKNPVSIGTIERGITALRKNSTSWRFEDIWYRACARGRNRKEIARNRAKEDRYRRHRRIKISPAGFAHNVTPTEVLRRLLAYITSAVRKSGRAHVDPEFCRQFQTTTGLPLEWIEMAAQRINKIYGCNLRHRGEGAGRKLVVTPKRKRRKAGESTAPETASRDESLPQNNGGTSFSYGEEDQKQRAQGAQISRIGSSNAAEAATLDARQLGATQRLQLSNPSGTAPPFANHPKPGSDHAPPRENTASARGVPARTAVGDWWRSNTPDDAPFEIAGRWVVPGRLAKLAHFLAIGPMRAPHVQNFRVVHKINYARNFAYRNLRLGHAGPAIVAAYAAGVARSHEDSLDHDKTQIDRDTRREPQRLPSAAVFYATGILAADTRTREVRWREFFAAPRAPVEHKTTPREREATEVSWQVSPAKPARPAPELLRALRAKIAAVPQAETPAITQTELIAHLARTGMTIGQFASLSWHHKQAIIRRAIASKNTSENE